MLDVTYEAVDDLPAGRYADIRETRGRVHIRLDRTQPIATVVRQLNIEIEDLLASATWFQLWGDEIVSRATPDAPIRIRYALLPGAPKGAGIAEDKGLLSFYINPDQDTEQLAASLNPAVARLLAGGRWFQLYAGEIIDHSPEPARQA